MKNLPILIVDDNEGDRYLLTRQLKDTQLPISKVFEAENGEDALEIFKNYEEYLAQNPSNYPPLLVFLDVNMPLIDGHTFLKEFNELRKRENLKSIIIMMFSTSEREEDKKNALEYDFVKDYLIKGTFDSDQLKERINDLFSFEC